MKGEGGLNVDTGQVTYKPSGRTRSEERKKLKEHGQRKERPRSVLKRGFFVPSSMVEKNTIRAKGNRQKNLP